MSDVGGGVGFRPPPPASGSLALVGVNVVPMDSERVIPHQTVIIDDGVVTMMGPADGVAAPSGARLDCGDTYLVPGLADMHVHCWEPTDLALYLANGVTTVRNMRGAPLHLALRSLVARRLVPGPNIVTTSPLIDGADETGRTTRPESRLLSDPADAPQLVQRLHHRGYQQMKVYDRLGLDALRAIGRASKDVGVRVTGHCPGGVTAEEATDAGLSCFEHLTWLPSSDAGAERIRLLADRMAAAEVWNCPTLVVSSAAARAARSDPSILALLRYYPSQLVARWQSLLPTRMRKLARPDDELDTADPRRIAEAVALEARRAVQTTGLLHRSGAPLLVGTDARNPYVVAGFSVHDELDHLLEAGLSPYQALRCATVEAARFLGESWRGTVATGQRADLLLVDRNPLTDLATLRRPVGVFVNGYAFGRPDLDDLLSQREAWARQIEQLPVTTVGRTPRASSRPPHRTGKHPPLIYEGELIESHFNEVVATTSYRHSRRPDDGWLIEESQAWTPSGTRRTTRLLLTSRARIVEGHWESCHAAGTESCECKRTPAGVFEVRSAAIDGARHRQLFSEAPLAPSEPLTASAFLILLHVLGEAADPSEVSVPAMTIQDGEAAIVWLRVSQDRRPTHDGRTTWRVTAESPGQPTTTTYHLGHREITVCLEGHREVIGTRREVGPRCR
jgi:imidazolonepropionase-like amidohydrolase